MIKEINQLQQNDIKITEGKDNFRTKVNEAKIKISEIDTIIRRNMPTYEPTPASEKKLKEFEARAKAFREAMPADAKRAGGASIKNKRKTKRRKSKTKRRRKISKRSKIR